MHEFGDLTNGCASTGTHFNPTNKTHGNLNEENSHVGDLGNVKFSQGKVVVDLLANKIQLTGDQSVIGRALVVSN